MKALVEDLIKVQKNLPSVKKTAKGNFGNHLDLEEIMPKVLKVMGDNNFAVVQSPSSLDGKPSLKTTFLHISGEAITNEMLLVLDKPTAQGQGSAITYARRYAICSMLGLVADKDDDGQKATDEKVDAQKVASVPQTQVRDRQLADISKILDNAGVEKDKQKAVLEFVLEGRNVRDLEFTEVVKLIEDLKALQHQTLVNISNGEPF